MANYKADLLVEYRKRTDTELRNILREMPANSTGAMVAAEALAERASSPKDIETRGSDIDESAGRRENYWRAKFGAAGFSVGAYDTRALGEDVTSGAGAASAVVPTVVSSSVIDLLRPATILDKIGATFFDMQSEFVNVPVWTADVAPAYVAEGASVSLDANPGFSALAFSAKGLYSDITLISTNAIEDAVTSGGLAAYVEAAIAKKYARLLDTTFLTGTSGNAGNPGIYNESNLTVQSLGTNGATPTTPDFLSTAVQTVLSANDVPNFMLMHPKAAGTIERLKASTGDYPAYWELPRSVQPLTQVVSSTVPAAETQGTAAGTTTSILVGNGQNVMVGMRRELSVKLLVERYADQNCVGVWSTMRFSIRTAHPEAMVRVTGLIPA